MDRAIRRSVFTSTRRPPFGYVTWRIPCEYNSGGFVVPSVCGGFKRKRLEKNYYTLTSPNNSSFFSFIALVMSQQAPSPWGFGSKCLTSQGINSTLGRFVTMWPIPVKMRVSSLTKKDGELYKQSTWRSSFSTSVIYKSFAIISVFLYIILILLGNQSNLESLMASLATITMKEPKSTLLAML